MLAECPRMIARPPRTKGDQVERLLGELKGVHAALRRGEDRWSIADRISLIIDRERGTKPSQQANGRKTGESFIVKGRQIRVQTARAPFGL
jgi:hypothetical protein